MSARARSGDVRVDRSLPNVSRLCGLPGVVEPELALRRVPRRRERRGRARQRERREHHARQRGVHYHGDHAATAPHGHDSTAMSDSLSGRAAVDNSPAR